MKHNFAGRIYGEKSCYAVFRILNLGHIWVVGTAVDFRSWVCCMLLPRTDLMQVNHVETRVMGEKMDGAWLYITHAPHQGGKCGKIVNLVNITPVP